MKRVTKQLDGTVVHIFGRVELHERSFVEDAHAIGERERLALVVGDVDRRGPGFTGQCRDLEAKLFASIGVEVGERFVKEDESHVGGQCPRQSYALLLAAGELVGVSIAQMHDAHAL